jgi:hypothetical protein
MMQVGGIFGRTHLMVFARTSYRPRQGPYFIPAGNWRING